LIGGAIEWAITAEQAMIAKFPINRWKFAFFASRFPALIIPV
jgi:hypothetical protein